MALVRVTDKMGPLEYPAGHVLHTTGTFIFSPRVSPSADLVAFIEHEIDSFSGSVAVVDRAGKNQNRTPIEIRNVLGC